MKKIKFLLLSLVALTLFSACGTTSVVPVTGRKHTLLVSDAEVLSLSNQEYTKYMRSAKRSSNAANTAMVQRVGKRLATAVEGYLDRKSTRLNSSHANISYAVFCLKKKKN